MAQPAAPSLAPERVGACGDILQRGLVAATAFSDAKVSRLLDRLEERGLVVRERQGMSNRVHLTLRDRSAMSGFVRESS